MAMSQTATIKDIVVKGNQNVSKEAILAAMTSKVGGTFLQATLDTDRQAIEDLGFFQAVNLTSKVLDDTNREVTVEVVEWPMIKEFRVVGNKVVKSEDIIKELDLQVGQVFNGNRQVSSSRKITALYSRRGYFAQIEEFAPMRESPNTITISIVELSVNSVAIQGNIRTKDRVLKRLVKTRAGDTFSLEKWQQDLRRLINTNWFEDVKGADSQPELGKVDLVAQVREQRTGLFNVGVQLDPRSSLAGLLKISDTNFNGTGQSVGIDFLQSTTGGGGPSIELSYTNPFIDSRDTSFRASLYSRLIYRFSGAFGTDVPNNTDDDEEDQFSERRTGAALGLTRPIGDNTSYSVAFRGEGVKTENLDQFKGSFIQQDGTVYVVTLGYTDNSRDYDFDPSRGYYYSLYVEPGMANIDKVGGQASNQSLLGKANFIRAGVDLRKYWTLGAGRTLRELDKPVRVIAARVRYGQIFGDVPFAEQFFVGGSDSLRGYTEDRYWGKQQILATLEYRHPIQKAFNVIGFMDFGGAFGGYETVGNFTQRSQLHFGYGVGFSFKTPLGPIRLDFGFNEKGKSRTHFLIGTPF